MVGNTFGFASTLVQASIGRELVEVLFLPIDALNCFGVFRGSVKLVLRWSLIPLVRTLIVKNPETFEGRYAGSCLPSRAHTHTGLLQGAYVLGNSEKNFFVSTTGLYARVSEEHFSFLLGYFLTSSYLLASTSKFSIF